MSVVSTPKKPRSFTAAFFRRTGRKAWEGLTPEERQKRASKNAKSYWQKLTAAERSAEMRRRAKVRSRNRRRKERGT